MKKFTVMFNSGLSFEDIITVEVTSTDKETALIEALNDNPELSGWKNIVI